MSFMTSGKKFLAWEKRTKRVSEEIRQEGGWRF